MNEEPNIPFVTNNEYDTPPAPEAPGQTIVMGTKEITLTEEQAEAASKIEEWFYFYPKRRVNFRLGGYAGTGKTTLIRFIKDKDRKRYVTICAFTGKAVHVLQRKGLKAQTIHSLLYDIVPQAGGQVTFVLKSRLDPDPDLIIVDEASMVSKDLKKDLESFGIPILYVGDPGQLEPVGDNPDLMKDPDFVLSKIHRQAEASPIITLATTVRTGGVLLKRFYDENCIVRGKQPFQVSEAAAADQVICATNRTRQNFNTAIRKFRGFPAGGIVEGEKLICLRNNTNFQVFNGMLFSVRKIHEDLAGTWICDLVDEMGNTMYNRPVWQKPFQHEVSKDEPIPKDVVYCDYGYVITCHKSQGSEWDNVIVYDEWMPPKVWDMKRWRYTAITRAAKKLTYLL